MAVFMVWASLCLFQLDMTSLASSSSTPPPDGPTIWEPSVVNLREDVLSETDIAAINCTDNTVTATPGSTCLSCNIVDVKPDFDGFQVWMKDGNTDFHLYYVNYLPNTQLNYEAVQNYNVTIGCHGRNLVTSPWLIRVDIQRNQAPVFSAFPQDTVTVNASATAKDVVIYKTNVTDAENDALQFTWNILPATSLFTVNHGSVSTEEDLRTTTTATYVITMNVTDGRRTTGPFTLTILLTDLNTRPTCSSFPSTLSIQEDAPSGEWILNLTCVDLTPHQDMVPVMSVEPTAEKWKFRLNAMTLRLNTTTNNLLDAESTQSYTICFRLSDGFLDAEYCVTLIVLNVNESPQCNSNTLSCSLQETSISSPTSFCEFPHFNPTDPENDLITSISIFPSPVSYYFSWDTARRRLSLTQLYDVDDRTKSPTLTLQLVVQDAGGAATNCTVEVRVQDRNDNGPVISGNNFYVITPDTPVPSILTTLVVTDNDLTFPNNATTLKLTDMTPPNGGNYIHLDNGRIRYIRRVDASVLDTTFTMEIEARDNGIPSRTTSRTIYISVQAQVPTTNPPTGTLPPTAAVATMSGQNSGQSSGQSNSTAEDGGLLSTGVGVALVAALCAVAAVLLLTGGFFLFGYLNTGSCPGSPPQRHLTTYRSHGNVFGSSNSRISPNTTEHPHSRHHRTNHHYGYNRYR